MRLSNLPLFAYLSKIRPGEKRFLALVPLTGLATGLAAVGVVRLMALVQKLFWGGGRDLLQWAEAGSPLHRVLALFLGGVLVGRKCGMVRTLAVGSVSYLCNASPVASAPARSLCAAPASA